MRACVKEGQTVRGIENRERERERERNKLRDSGRVRWRERGRDISRSEISYKYF
jgi:hypothetical protein